MSLRSLKLPFYVTTSEHDPVKEFFDPVLERAKKYDIAVGYFSSAWLRDAAHGISSFALNGGKARWIISPELSPEDFRSLQVEGEISDAQTRDLISRSYENLYQQLTQHTREALGWLITDGILTFKIGIPRNRLSGILHAKQGMFADENGDRIGFLGSYNLTAEPVRTGKLSASSATGLPKKARNGSAQSRTRSRECGTALTRT